MSRGGKSTKIMVNRDKTTTGGLIDHYLSQKGDRGWTQTHLAGKIGVSAAEVSRWVTGERPLPEKRRHEIAKVLDIQQEDLLPGAPMRSDVKRLYIREIDKMSDSEVRAKLEEHMDSKR